MRISVALATYNGLPYLHEQLASLLRQARRPDELVVIDDASTDQTPQAIGRFARAAPFPVHLHINPQNLGSTASFDRAIAACTGDAIALCDQDDLWLEQKLARLEQALDRNPQAVLACCDALVVDQALRPAGHTLWKRVRIDRRVLRQVQRGAALEVLLQRNIFTGATMIFRSGLRPRVLPIPASWVHDGWIALVAAAIGAIVMLPEALMMYRQHPGQQIGSPVLSLRQQLSIARTMDFHYFRQEYDKFSAALDRLTPEDCRPRPASPELLRALKAKVSHQAARLAMRNGRRRLRLALSELSKGHYTRYSIGWKAVAQDLFL